MSKIILKEEKIGDLSIKYSISKLEPCMINLLIINEVPTSVFSFGKILDVDHRQAPENYFGCMNRKFIPYSFIPDSLLKSLNISREDLSKINKFISSIVNRGRCDFCLQNIKKAAN